MTVRVKKKAAAQRQAAAHQKAAAKHPPRERILLSASQLFADRGLDGVTIRDIAAKAHVQLPALYRAFANKEALYLEASKMVFITFGDKYSAALSSAGPAKQRLFGHVASMYRDLLQDERLRKLLARETLFDEGKILETLAQSAFGPQFECVIDLCKTLGATEEVERRAFEIYVLAMGYVQMLPLARASQVKFSRWHDPATVARRILEFVLPEIDWADAVE